MLSPFDSSHMISQLFFDSEADQLPAEQCRSNDENLDTDTVIDCSVSSEKLGVSPKGNGGGGLLSNNIEDEQIDSPPRSQQQYRPSYYSVQNKITSYLVKRGSPRAMAMFKAASKSAVSSSRMSSVVIGSAAGESSDSDSNGPTGSSFGPKNVSLNPVSCGITSPVSLKRSLSCPDATASQGTSPSSSPQGSPKRSATFVGMSRGSLALKAAMKSPLVFSSTTSTSAASDDSNDSTLSKEFILKNPNLVGILRPPTTPQTSTSRKSIRVSFAAPLVTSELIFDSQSSLLGLDRVFNGSPSLSTLKRSIVDEAGESISTESPMCAIKKMRSNDNSTFVTSIELRSRDESVRSLRSARTCINLFKAGDSCNEPGSSKSTDEPTKPVSLKRATKKPLEITTVSVKDVPIEIPEYPLKPSALTNFEKQLPEANTSEELTSFITTIREMEEEEAAQVRAANQACTDEVEVVTAEFSPEPADPEEGDENETPPSKENGPNKSAIDITQDDDADIEFPDEIPETDELPEFDELPNVNGGADAVMKPIDALSTSDDFKEEKLQFKKEVELTEELIESEDLSEIPESPIIAMTASSVAPPTTGTSSSSVRISRNFDAASPGEVLFTIATTLSSNTSSSVTKAPLNFNLKSSQRAYSIIRQAATRSPIVSVEPTCGPSSPPTNSRSASISSGPSSSSFRSPLNHRGIACLQAVKAKQAERVRRDTPMPITRAKSLTTTITPVLPKSILRQSINEGKCDWV